MQGDALVLDCSAFIDVFYGPNTPYLQKLSQALLSHTVIVPSLFLYEATNVLLNFLKRNIINESDLRYGLPRIESLPDRIVEIRDMQPIAQLAHRFQLTVYDAAYLAVAKSHHAPLATLDAALKKAALAENAFYDPA